MLIPIRTCIQNLFKLTILLAICNAALAAPEQAGISHALAIGRAAQVLNLRYHLSFKLKEHESAIAGTEVLTFECKFAGDLPIDYRDGILRSVTLNGHASSRQLENGHLHLAVVSGENTLKVEFVSNATPAGKAITRYEDKDDGSEYFYTLFVPMDASMAFPCFDQPDLKARFTLDLEHPAQWTVIGNGIPTAHDITHTSFSETRPISTYLFAFAAGPFTAIRAVDHGGPTLYVRRSQNARGQLEAAQVQQMAERGVAYFAAYFAQPFPFPKYDLVLIPGFPFGGMEHAGATFLNEDSVLFRSTPTASDYFRRNTLVLHETCHQWFGDLVTMRWFDDLWLKEGFAQYMAYKALARLEPRSNPWKHFSEDIKPLAYRIDETQGTTPIFQNIPNLRDAKSAYGAIVYQKAPAVLKQLNFYLGDEAFRNGLRIYLREHAYGNAEWSDLVAAFQSSSNQLERSPDVKGWADAWILRRGMPEVQVSWSCAHGQISEFTLHQKDVLGQGYVWPISMQVFGESGSGPGNGSVAPYVLRVDWHDANHVVSAAIGRPCPAYVFTNYSDQAYGRFLLDQVSEAAMKPRVPNPDPLLHSMLWQALWEDVRLARSSPRSFIELALGNFANDETSDEALVRIQSVRLATALHSYMTPSMRQEFIAHVEETLSDAMLHNPDLGLRIVNLRAFPSIAETPPALQEIKELLSGTLVVPGLKLRPLDRWTLLEHLIEMSDPEAPALYAAERERDHSGEAQKYAFAVEAASRSAEIKAKYFEEYLHAEKLQEDWITQSLRPFNSWNQSTLTQPYLPRALTKLPDIKMHRKIFFLGAWINAFIEGQNTLQSSPQALAMVKAWLAGKDIDPDLRLKVLEGSDALERTVQIGLRFPR